MSRSSLIPKDKKMGPLLNEQICYALYSTSGKITQAYKKFLDPHDLTYPQLVIMMALWHNNGASLTHLAKEVGLSKGTLTPIIKRLESMGFLERRFAVGNERTKSMLLTKKGQEFSKEGERITNFALCATGLTHIESKTLIELCSKIKASLDDK